MSKTINLNNTVRIKLTEHGLNAYMEAFPYKDKKSIIDNDMFVEEQLWIIMANLNSFSNGSPNKNPFMEITFNDSILEDCLQPYEDKLIEAMCHEMFDHWLGKHYTNNTRRYFGRNPKTTILSRCASIT